MKMHKGIYRAKTLFQFVLGPQTAEGDALSRNEMNEMKK